MSSQIIRCHYYNARRGGSAYTLRAAFLQRPQIRQAGPPHRLAASSATQPAATAGHPAHVAPSWTRQPGTPTSRDTADPAERRRPGMVPHDFLPEKSSPPNSPGDCPLGRRNGPVGALTMPVTWRGGPEPTVPAHRDQRLREEIDPRTCATTGRLTELFCWSSLDRPRLLVAYNRWRMSLATVCCRAAGMSSTPCSAMTAWNCCSS